MPPALSDDEASDVGETSITLAKREKRKPVDYSDAIKIDDDDDEDDDEVAENGDENEDEGEGQELDEDEYIVEKILDHMLDEDGTIRYKVKWEGYEKKSDQTWEDEDNLRENASSVLDEYLSGIGGRDSIYRDTADVKKTKKRGRQSAGAAAGGSTKRSRRDHHPKSATPPASAVEWKPPAGSWEDHIANLDAAQDEGTNGLVIYLDWKDGHRTKHGTDVIYKRCPQKMLKFYERHVRIVPKQDVAPADDEQKLKV